MTSANHKYAFLDTNTLMHFRPMEEVNWCRELDAQAVTLLLVPVVIRELDRHKDLHSRKKIRQRVHDRISKLSKLLDKGPEHEIREAVTLRMEAQESLLDFNQHGLRLDQPDDHLIASILQFRHDQPNAQAVLVTADLGLKVKALSRQVEVRTLPDSLKIPEEPDEEQKQIRELQAKLAAHENRLPKLRLVFPAQTDRLEIIRSPVQIPSDADIAEEVDAVRKKFAADSNDLRFSIPPSSDAEEQYQSFLEAYFQKHASYLREQQEAKKLQALTISLDILLFNEGTAPAEDIDVSLFLPPGLEVRDSDPRKPEPKPPKAPKQPLHGPFAYLDLVRQWDEVPPPTLLGAHRLMLPHSNVSIPDLTKGAEGFEVNVHVKRSKQNQPQSLGMLYVMFSEQNVVRSFQLRYVLNAANFPHNIEGKLHVIVKDK